MLYMVQIEYQREQRDGLFAYFENHGVTGYAKGVELSGAWVSPEDCVAFALVKVVDVAAFETESQRLTQFGTVTSRHVLNAEDL